MKKYILKIVLFFAIVAIVDFFFGQFCDKMNAHAKGGDTKQLYDLVRRDHHDVLVFGSSRAHHHYVPTVLEDVLNMECYNAGYDGNGVVLAYPILAHVTERHKPAVVVFEVSRGFDIAVNEQDKKNTRYISRLKPFYRIPAVTEVIKSVSYNDYLQVHSGLYRYNSTFVHMAMDNVLNMEMDPKGYQALSGTYVNDKIRKPFVEHPLDSLKIHYLVKMADLGKKLDINMVWVLSPQFFDESEEHKVYDVSKRIAEEHDIPFLDYYTDPDFVGREDLFRDATHMNDTGARLFSDKVANDIKKLFNI